MFWKKDQNAGGGGSKVLSPKKTIMGEIEALTNDHVLTYKLGEAYWGGLGAYTMVELNKEYPQKGKKYLIFTDNMGENKPAGTRKKLWTSNKSKEIAGWILDKEGTRVNV